MKYRALISFWSPKSLAARIAALSASFGLIVTGGAIVIGVYALSQKLDTRAAVELQGKRSLLLHMLSEISTPEAILQNQHGFQDLLIGHDDLHLALTDPASGQILGSFSAIAEQSMQALDASANITEPI